MKNLIKKTMVPAFAAAFCILAAGQAQAVSVSVFQVNLDDPANNNPEIVAWLNSQGMAGDPINNLTILEDFENQTPDWYQTLDTGVGRFTAAGEPGTGSTSYNRASGNYSDDPYFQVRDFDANGRYNVYPLEDTGTNYLDSADITELSLDLNPGLYENIFFTITDPGDILANTIVSSGTGSNSIDFRNSNGSLWFVGIDGEGDMLSNVTWNTNNAIAAMWGNDTPYTNDGYGLDGFGTVTGSVPEPATALLLGAGLIPLMGFLRRKKEEDEV